MVDVQHLLNEYAKCYIDKSRVYMIQNYLKTYDATQRREVPFKLFPRQQDLCTSLGNASNVVTTKPRQAGITTTSGAFISCEMVLADKSSPQTVLAIGNTLDLAQQMLFKIRDFLLQFPLWMWGNEFMNSEYDITKPPENKNVIFEVCNNKELRLKNGCKVVARSSGPDASRGVGGVTWLIFDEAAFIENGKDVYASALPTVSTGGHIIMISTPNGKDQLYYETCRKARLKGSSDWNNFELVEMKWYQDPRYNKFLEWYRKNDKTGETDIEPEVYIDKEGNVEYTPEKWFQREKDGWKPRSNWYIKMCQQFNNDEQKIAQELDVSFLGSASNVVAPEYIEMQQRLNVREPDPSYHDPLSEDTWVWKMPIEGHRYLMSIDCSRGDAADRTALEIIDLDGIDEDGKPCIEQVLEYHGKKTGDDVGEMAFHYGKMYGNAFTIIDCIGGTGDACILTMMRLGYTNLYYDDPNLKTYTIQREASSLGTTADGKLPGFHSSSVRFQMLTNFAHMVKTNAFKIRSKRVISELDTWIYKGEAARIDHMDGCHDDTLTCLAMALFVMQFSLDKMQKAKQADAAILSSWTTNTSIKQTNTYTTNNSLSMTPNNTMPFYSDKQYANPFQTSMGDCLWLFAGKR
jgi:hypothetical protein